MRILNFGSCNIDYVYTVEHIVVPGETVSSSKLELFAGGKGLNQSIAAARAGAKVFHAGCLGNDGGMLKEVLVDSGVDISNVTELDTKNGHAIIQVSSQGENSIFLYPGSNALVTKEIIDSVLKKFGKDDILLPDDQPDHHQKHQRRHGIQRPEYRRFYGKGQLYKEFQKGHKQAQSQKGTAVNIQVPPVETAYQNHHGSDQQRKKACHRKGKRQKPVAASHGIDVHQKASCQSKGAGGKHNGIGLSEPQRQYKDKVPKKQGTDHVAGPCNGMIDLQITQKGNDHGNEEQKNHNHVGAEGG